MANYRVIDNQNWPRKDHFDFYRGFANPSFNLCVPVEAQRLYECAKDRGVSFFQLALYALVRAANGVPQLKQRQLGDDIIEYDQLAVMTPVMTAQEGFRQVWCDNAADFAAFSHAATPNIEAAKHTAPAPLIVNGENFFCASCLPWLHFSAITHAEYYVGAAVPALTWGKLKTALSRWRANSITPLLTACTPAASLPGSKRVSPSRRPSGRRDKHLAYVTGLPAIAARYILLTAALRPDGSPPPPKQQRMLVLSAKMTD